MLCDSGLLLGSALLFLGNLLLLLRLGPLLLGVRGLLLRVGLALCSDVSLLLRRLLCRLRFLLRLLGFLL